MGKRIGFAKWLVLTVLCHSFQYSEEEEIPAEKVMEEFISIPGMRMAEYNFWWSTGDLEECARFCLEESRVYCKSFSYSWSAIGCGTYENSRAEAPAGMYGEPMNPVTESGISPSWDYYERKSKEYKALEQKMQRLENLTEISVEEATEVLSEFGASLRTEEDPVGSGDEMTVAPGELDLMSKMLKLVVNLNPIAEATAEVSEQFAKVLVNVSDSMMQPTHAQSWISLQRNPEADGIAGIVTSSEVVSRDVSKRLLFYDNSTSIVAESDNIGMWMDIVEFPDTTAEDHNILSIANLSEITIDAKFMEQAGQILGGDSNEMYVFPSESTVTKKRYPIDGNSTASEDAILADDVIMLPRKALRNRSVVTHVRYKGLGEVMPPRDINEKNAKNGTTYAVKSAVMTTSIHPRPAKSIFEEEPVILIFTHYQSLEEDPGGNGGTESPEDVENSSASPPEATTVPSTIETTVHCVFWEEGDGTESGGWSGEGCELESSNETHTICKCKHLTSFAVLLKMVDTSIQDESYLLHIRALSFISYIGCALSLGGVVIMCGAFVMLKFHTENMKIHFNLGVAVGAADLVFMFEELAQQHQYSCVLVTVLLYYFNMAVLSWMLIEGLFLYSQVVVVFVSARRWVKYYMFAGWGVPAIIMGISMGILNVQLGSNKICWLSPADNSIWAFAAPAILVVAINFIILISVVRVIVGIQPDQTNNVKISKVKNAVKGSIFLSPLLGTTWLFGLLSISGETLLFEYVFATTNSLQGFFLFVFHCLCNSEVRADFARRHSWKSTSTNSGKSPPWFSGSFGLNVASGIRRFRESISFDFASSSHSENTGDASRRGSNESPKSPRKKLPLIPDMDEESGEIAETHQTTMHMVRRTKTSRLISLAQKTEHLDRREKTDIVPHEQPPIEIIKNPLKLDGSSLTLDNDADNDNDPQYQGSGQDEKTTTQGDVPSVKIVAEEVEEETPVVRKKHTLPPLPMMPMKNDIILNGRTNKVAPMPSPASQRYEVENETNVIVVEERNNHWQKRTPEPPITNEPAPITDQGQTNPYNDLDDETEKDGYKIAMSYDSGLNSIDNESLLEEEYYDEFVEMPYGKYRVGINGCDFAM